MKLTALPFRYLCLLMVVALSACTGVAVKEPETAGKMIYPQRAARIDAIDVWGFSGKISLDDGDQGGSGKLRWDAQADSFELDFHGAMGRGAWNLQVDPQRAVLKEASGEQRTAASVNDLIQARIGWPLPVDALRWWVRGLAAPGMIDAERFDSQGLLLHLDQFGWSVDINRYKTFADLQMPIRVDARRDNYRVKLAISRWQMGDGTQQ